LHDILGYVMQYTAPFPYGIAKISAVSRKLDVCSGVKLHTQLSFGLHVGYIALCHAITLPFPCGNIGHTIYITVPKRVCVKRFHLISRGFLVSLQHRSHAFFDTFNHGNAVPTLSPRNDPISSFT